MRASDSSNTAEVTNTYSTVGSIRVDTILSADLAAPFSLTPAMLRLDTTAVPRSGYNSSSAVWWAVSINASTLASTTLQAHVFTEDAPIPLTQSATRDDFELWHVVPATSYGAVLGELSDKWLPLAGNRFTALTADDASQSFTVQATGAPGEPLNVWFAKLNGHELLPAMVKCTVGASGLVTITWPVGTCM